MSLKKSRRGQIPPFIVMDVLRAANERAATGAAVHHLEVGQPATRAPEAVRAAARRAVDEDLLGYTEALGIPELRQALAAHYRTEYGLTVPAERICLTKGSSGGFALAFLAAFDPGDRVALAAPGYPAYRNILVALGLEPVLLPVGPETRFQPSAAALAALEAPVDGLILASPSNPTGSMITPDALAELVDYCHRNGIRMISDEIYHGITYGTVPQCSALELGDEAVVINSFSKYFSMTGWRLGWMIVPPDLLRTVECLQQNLFISAPTLSQCAALAAFECRDELDANVARYAENRQILLEELPKAGFRDFAPADGAFYLYADVRHLTDDAAALCRQILAETGVAITPGTDFDPARGRHFVRLSFAGSPQTMRAATIALQNWAQRRG